MLIGLAKAVFFLIQNLINWKSGRVGVASPRLGNILFITRNLNLFFFLFGLYSGDAFWINRLHLKDSQDFRRNLRSKRGRL
jgi:hypothetical protein